MTVSIQTLIEEFKAVVFENDEMEYRDMSQLKAFSKLLAYHDFDSNIGNNFLYTSPQVKHYPLTP